MIKYKTKFKEVFLIKPKLHTDKRGCFYELFQKNNFSVAGISGPWFQDNISITKKGIVRGLHFQFPKSQGKLVSVVAGSIYDVIVDIRTNSPTFGKWLGVNLSEENGIQVWIPEGFAHGFQATSMKAYVHYRCSGNFWMPQYEQTISCLDPFLSIKWPLKIEGMNEKDKKGFNLIDAKRLPKFKYDNS